VIEARKSAHGLASLPLSASLKRRLLIRRPRFRKGVAYSSTF
jgi:hypothetical protein